MTKNGNTLCKIRFAPVWRRGLKIGPIKGELNILRWQMEGRAPSRLGMMGRMGGTTERVLPLKNFVA